MIVVVHQHQRVQAPTAGLDRAAKPFEPFAPIDVIADNLPPLVSARKKKGVRTIYKEKRGQNDLLRKTVLTRFPRVSLVPSIPFSYLSCQE